MASSVRLGTAPRRSLSEALGGSPATKTFIMKNKRAATQRDYHSPDNSQILTHTSFLDQSLLSDSTRSLKATLNQKEIEILHLHTKCYKWKQRCKALEDDNKRLNRKLGSCEEAYKALKERYAAQVQAAKAYEERRKGLEHFHVQDTQVSIRLQQAQIQSLQTQIEALESAQTAILNENARLKQPTEESETALRLLQTDLTSVYRDLTEMSKVLQVYLHQGDHSVTDILNTLLHKSQSLVKDTSPWVKLVSLVRDICREVAEIRTSLARVTEPEGLTALLTAQD